MVNACPTCHRSSTWSAKWQTCSACAEPIDTMQVVNDGRDQERAFTYEMERKETKLHRGRPTIGERAMTSTERVQRHRERKAKTS